MLAVHIYGPGDIRIEEIPMPVPRAGEALVRIHSLSLCSQDLAFYCNGKRYPDNPVVPGSDCAGEIISLGGQEPGTANSGLKPGRRLMDTPRQWSTGAPIQVGDRVALESLRPCGECEPCRSGRHNLCRSLRLVGQPPLPGVLCEYVAAPLSSLAPVPGGIGYGEASLIEPIAAAIHAVQAAGVTEGSRVAISGAGALGLSILQVAAARGASLICVIEPLPSRRQIADRLGATIAIDPAQADIDLAIAELTGGRGLDIAFETSGNVQAIAKVTDWVRSGGVLTLVGIPDEQLILPPSIIRREILVRAAYHHCSRLSEAFSLLEAGEVSTRDYVTHQFPISEAALAFEMAARHPEQSLRVLINLSPAQLTGSQLIPLEALSPAGTGEAAQPTSPGRAASAPQKAAAASVPGSPRPTPREFLPAKRRKRSRSVQSRLRKALRKQAVQQWLAVAIGLIVCLYITYRVVLLFHSTPTPVSFMVPN